MVEGEEPGGPGQALHWRAARERGYAESQPLTVQDLARSRVPACKRARTRFSSRRVRSRSLGQEMACFRHRAPASCGSPRRVTLAPEERERGAGDSSWATAGRAL